MALVYTDILNVTDNASNSSKSLYRFAGGSTALSWDAGSNVARALARGVSFRRCCVYGIAMSDEKTDRDLPLKRSSSDKRRHSTAKSTKRKIGTYTVADEKRFKPSESSVNRQTKRSPSPKNRSTMRTDSTKSTKGETKRATHHSSSSSSKSHNSKSDSTQKKAAGTTAILSSHKYDNKRKKPTNFYETVNRSINIKRYALEEKLLNSDSDSSTDKDGSKKMNLNDELFQDILFEEQSAETMTKQAIEPAAYTPPGDNSKNFERNGSPVLTSTVGTPKRASPSPIKIKSPIQPPPPSVPIHPIVNNAKPPPLSSYFNTIDNVDASECSDMDISEISSHTPDANTSSENGQEQEDQLYLLSLAKPVRIVPNEIPHATVRIPPPLQPQNMIRSHFPPPPASFLPQSFAPHQNFMPVQPQPPINPYSNNHPYSSSNVLLVGSQPPQQVFQPPHQMQSFGASGAPLIGNIPPPSHHQPQHNPFTPTPPMGSLPHSVRVMVQPPPPPIEPCAPHINTNPNFPTQYSNYRMAPQPHINYSALNRVNIPPNGGGSEPTQFVLNNSHNRPPPPLHLVKTPNNKLPFQNNFYGNGNNTGLPSRCNPAPPHQLHQTMNLMPNQPTHNFPPPRISDFDGNCNESTVAVSPQPKNHLINKPSKAASPQRNLFDLLPAVTKNYLNKIHNDSTAKTIAAEAIYRDYHKNWSGISRIWGERSLNSFEIACQVGEGTYGKVYRSKDLFRDETVALKKIRNNFDHEGFPITAVREIKILRQLCHPNIVKLRDVISDKSNVADFLSSSGAFYLVFEYMEHDLLGVLESSTVTFSVLQIQSLFKQLIEALNYCHNRNFLHRDLKCSNILLNNKGVLKLADFGLARLYESEGRPYTNNVITLWYRPPEILFGQERYGPYVDIWSAGCILGELFTKRPILSGNKEITQLDRIFKLCGSPTLKSWPDVIHLPLYQMMKPSAIYPRKLRNHFQFLPPDAIDLMDQMLQLDPHKRITSSNVLKSSFLVDIDPSKIEPPKFPDAVHFHELLYKKRSKSKNSENQKNKAGSNKPSDVKDSSNSFNSASRFNTTGSSEFQKLPN